MTQGEILSAFAPLHTLCDICIGRRCATLTISDVNMMMSYVAEAQKAAEQLSSFALNHFNSPDENNRELSKIIYERFCNLRNFIPSGNFHGDSSSVDILNNSLKNIMCFIQNTIYSYNDYMDILPPLKSEDEENMDKGAAIGGAIDGVGNEQFDEKKEKIGEESMIDKNISIDEKFTLRERLVFFFTVLSLDNDKKYTNLSNLAKFVSELCKDQNNIVPFISKMKKAEEASKNAKAAKRVADMMKQIIHESYRNDENLTINKLIESIQLNFPEEEE